MAKQTVKQRKALRSEAAKKGWETRREREEDRAFRDRLDANAEEGWRAVVQEIYPPKPSLWQRIKGWFA